MHQTLGQKRGGMLRPCSMKGFTLVELLVVIAIIGILAGMILGFSGYVTRKSDRSKAIADIEKLKNAMEEYRIKTGIYWPSNGAVTQRIGVVYFSNEMKNVSSDLKFFDPWGRPYEYTKLGTYQFKIWSYGPDKLETNDNIDSTSGSY